MAEQFKQIPSPLQKQILIRLAGSGLGIVMLILILAYRGSWQLMLPGIAIFLAFTLSAWLLFRKCVQGAYYEHGNEHRNGDPCQHPIA